jgi:hypothetical protein
MCKPLPTVAAGPMFCVPTKNASVTEKLCKLRVRMSSEFGAVERPSQSCPEPFTASRRLLALANFTAACGAHWYSIYHTGMYQHTCISATVCASTE